MRELFKLVKEEFNPGPESTVGNLNNQREEYVPEEFVDISDEIDLKIQMLECHESQLKWMRDHDNIDFAEFVKTCSRFRGLQCGVDYAEAFTQEFVWPKVVAKRLLP